MGVMTETKTRSSNNPVKIKLKLEARFTATSMNERLDPCEDWADDLYNSIPVDKSFDKLIRRLTKLPGN